MGQLQGKMAIVTGAAGGFGEGIAKRFVAEGAKVLIVDLDGAKAQKVATALGSENIRVNAICPVMGATGLISQFVGGQDTPEARAKVTAGIPLGRMSTPDDIAAACLYLASDGGRFITGIELPVDGGRTI